MTYQERRKAGRARLKAELLVIIQEAEANGVWIESASLAYQFRVGPSTVRALRAELAREKLVADPAQRQIDQCDPIVPDLDKRIEAVRAAKMAKLPHRSPKLTTRQLAKVLPT